jgi:hypothetical protein
MLPVTVRKPAIYGVDRVIEKNVEGTSRSQLLKQCRQNVSGRAEEINGKVQLEKPIPVPRFGLVDLGKHNRLILHFIMFSVITNIYNKKTQQAHTAFHNVLRDYKHL